MSNIIDLESTSVEWTQDSFRHFDQSVSMSLAGDTTACSEQYRPTNLHLSGIELEDLYFESFLIQQLCEFLPTETIGTFRGWSSLDDKKVTPEILKKASLWFRRKVSRELIDAASMGRLAGDCYLLCFLDDEEDTSKPVNYSKLKNIKGFLAIPDYDISFDGTNYDTSQQATISHSDQYHLLTFKDTLNTYHVSRLIRLPGKILPKMIRDRNTNYRNQSVIETFLPAYSGWISANIGVVQMLETHSAFKLGMKGLAFKTKAKDSNGLAGRFRMLMTGMKKLKALIYDTDNEDADFINRTYTNIDKVLRSLDTYLATFCDTPLPFLVDGTQAYESASRGAREALSRSVQKYQLTHLRPALERLMWLWLVATEGEDKALTMFDYIVQDWSDGLILTSEEQADLEFKHAQRDVLLTGGQQVLHADEVRSRFRNGRYHNDLLVDAKKKAPKPSEQKIEMGGEENGFQGGTNKGKFRDSKINALTSKEGRSPQNGHKLDDKEVPPTNEETEPKERKKEKK